MTGPDASTEHEVAPLAGYTVGVTAERRREELGTSLERRGARVMYGTAIRVVPVVDDTELRAATEAVLSAPLDLAVATTGVGFRGWMDAAVGWDLGGALTQRLAEATILTRGPKARGAVRGHGLRDVWSPESESSDEVLAHLLANYELDGRRIAIQLHGDPLREVVDTLRARGAEVIDLTVYRWESPVDEAPLHRLIEATVAGAVDALTFTSAPAATNVLRTAAELGLADQLFGALTGPVLCAGVGPVTAAPLEQAGIPVTQPVRARLGALVREVSDRLPERAPVLVAAGHRLELRGHAVLVDSELIPLPVAGMTVLRQLAHDPGRVHSRLALTALLPGGGDDGHAVDTAIARLRAALGDPAIVQTVVKRGYRLSVDDAA